MLKLGKQARGQVWASPHPRAEPRPGEQVNNISPVLEVLLADQWVDLTCYVRGITFQRGTTQPVGPIQASVLSLEMSNPDGLLSPWADNTPWVPQGELAWRANLPIRFSITTTDIDLEALNPDVWVGLAPDNALGKPGDVLLNGTAVYDVKRDLASPPPVSMEYYWQLGWVPPAAGVMEQTPTTPPTLRLSLADRLGNSVSQQLEALAVGTQVTVTNINNATITSLVGTIGTKVMGGGICTIQLAAGYTGGGGLNLNSQNGDTISVVFQAPAPTGNAWLLHSPAPTQMVTVTGAEFVAEAATDLPDVANYPEGYVLLVTLPPGTAPNSSALFEYMIYQRKAGVWTGQTRLPVPDGMQVWSQDLAQDRFQLFTGTVDSWVSTDTAGDDSSVSVQASSAFKYLATYEYEPHSIPQELAGARIKRLAQEAGFLTHIAGGALQIDPGNLLMAATDAGRPALEAMQQVVMADGGILYVDRYGGLVYKDTDSLALDPEAVDWYISDGKAPDSLCASSMVTSADDLDVVNVVGVSNVNGISAWRQNDASIALHGRRKLEFTDLPHLNESDSGLIADRLLAERAALDYHIAQLTVHPISEPNGWGFAAQVDLMQLVRVIRLQGAQRLEDRARVMGIAHSLTPTSYSVILTLGPPTLLALNRGWDEAQWDEPQDEWSTTQ